MANIDNIFAEIAKGMNEANQPKLSETRKKFPNSSVAYRHVVANQPGTAVLNQPRFYSEKSREVHTRN